MQNANGSQSRYHVISTKAQQRPSKTNSQNDTGKRQVILANVTLIEAEYV